MSMFGGDELEIALNMLHEWTIRLCDCAGESLESAEELWRELKEAPEVLQEYAYYYDNQEFLCKYKIDNFTIADILIWQMDHFRAHMDREDSANRYNKDRLVLSAFKAMLEMRKNPDKIKSRFASETGTDLSGGWNIH